MSPSKLWALQGQGQLCLPVFVSQCPAWDLIPSWCLIVSGEWMAEHWPSEALVSTYIPLMFCFTFQNSFHSITGMPLFIGFCFIALHGYCFFFLNKLEVCSDSASSKSVGAIFPTACVHFLSLSCFGNFTAFQTLSLFFSLSSWSLMSGHWCYCSNLLKAQRRVSVF